MAKVETAPVMSPTMHLDGPHAEAFDGAQVGDTVHFKGHGQVASMSQTDGEDGPRKSLSIEVKHLKHKKKGKGVGYAGGPEAKLQAGGKAAMDEALANPDGGSDE